MALATEGLTVVVIQVRLVQPGASAEQIQFANGLVALATIYRYTVESRLGDRILSR